MTTKLGKWARIRREGLGITQADVAERMGPDVETNYVTKVETGRIKRPPAEMRRRLASALGVSHVDLLVAAGELADDEVGLRAVAVASEADQLLAQLGPEDREGEVIRIRAYVQYKRNRRAVISQPLSGEARNQLATK